MRFLRLLSTFFQGGIRLRVAILTLVCTLLVGALGVTMTYTFMGMGHIIDESSRDNISKTQKTIIDQISSYFGSVLRITQIGAWVGLKVPGNPINNDSLQSFMMGALFYIPLSTYVYMADTDGNFFGIFAVGNNRVMRSDPSKPLPPDAKIVVEKSNSHINYRMFTYMDAKGRPLLQEKVPFKEGVNYDPRTRPWFTDARNKMTAAWSEPYKDWEDNELALTATSPLQNEKGEFIGVIGADIPLRKLSEVLSKQKASRSGVNFLITTEGHLLGYPEIEKVHQNKEVGSILDVSEPSVKRAYEHYQTQHKGQFTFSLNSLDYLAYFTPFPKTINDNWILGMVAPSDDFMGSVKRMNHEVLYISLGILVFAILLLIIFSHHISYPIEILAEHMRHLKNLDIINEPLPKSRLQEISQMKEAITLVKESLTSFGKYVPKDLVLKLIQSGSHELLGGETKRLTIFFSDIENFTGISEKLPVDELMGYISAYFNQLSRIITNEKGTIDKYIGDSIMAFWGAPNEDENQIIHGCRAVLRCYDMTRERHHFICQTQPYFKTRFGLHHADVIVGNVGSSDRMNYTIFGDGVNVANRLESINKIYGTHVLVTEAIQKEVSEHFLFRIVDNVAFTGRKASSFIFEMLMEVSETDAYWQAKKWVELSNQAFSAYQEADFKTALDLYTQVDYMRRTLVLEEESVENHEGDPVSQVFIKRCQDYMHTPPNTWDGIFRVQKK